MTDSSDTTEVSAWAPPTIDLDTIKTGDMPGDKVQINQSHIDKANAAFPRLLTRLESIGGDRLVVSVYGGSGVGKSEIASLLGHYCELSGFPAYVLSGDNYARRVPMHNDQERLWTYRTGALNAFALDSSFSEEGMRSLQFMWPEMADMNLASDGEPSWMSVYREAGLKALTDYLGTKREIDFPMVNAVIESFKAGRDSIALKRMGQTAEDLWYEKVDLSRMQVLIVEWTHGNSPLLEGVDFPIFLFSTPAETRAHRLARGRDKNTDTPLISRVLEIEHEKLVDQAERAALIISKSSEVLSPREFLLRSSQPEGRS
ncbi:MAG: adenylylsulfate kinase [Actinobacteria bacterium HGW-Actinobacteria-8]|nr:MAG: adenylylsulfate kinase [Actinobacteria bacterium HGW-Actinobacteria-8]